MTPGSLNGDKKETLATSMPPAPNLTCDRSLQGDRRGGAEKSAEEMDPFFRGGDGRAILRRAGRLL